MKKLRYKIVLLVVIIWVVVFIIEKINNSPTRLLSSSDLKSYSKAYINKYKSLLMLVPPDYRDKIIFFTPSYYVEGIISSTHGAAVKLSASDREKVQITVTGEKIERAISPNARWPGRMVIDGINFRFINNPPPMFKSNLGGSDTGLTILNDSGRNQIANRQLDLRNGAEVCIYDGADQTIVKESNYKKMWTKQIAVRDATSEFLYQIRNSILENSKANNIAGSIKLAELAEVLKNREIKNEYDKNPELYFNDNMQYFELAKRYNISEPLATNILQELKRKSIRSLINQWLNYSGDKVVEIIVIVIGGILVSVVLKRVSKNANSKKGSKNKRRKK